MSEIATGAGVLLVRDFVNTREPQTGSEVLASPQALHSWFAGRGLVRQDVTMDDRDLHAVVAVREGLRELLLTHAGREADPRVLAELDRRLAQFPVRLSFDGGSARLLPSGSRPPDHAVGAIVEAIRAAAEDGSWPRLKVCARETCRWAFYDASRNQARRWCSMAGCGNYVKMRRVAEARRSCARR
jgi:predicted RNA-binding Zn ribbon-like protein